MSTQTQPGSAPSRAERTFFGQPWGLAIFLIAIRRWVVQKFADFR